MQVSSFSNNRIRKAGSLEATGRELAYSSRMSRMEIERQETQYDEFFTQSNRRQPTAPNSQLSRLTMRSSNSFINEDNEIVADVNIEEVEDSPRHYDRHPRTLKSQPKNFLRESEKKNKVELKSYDESELKIKQRNHANSDRFTDENNPFLVKSVKLPEKQVLEIYNVDEDFQRDNLKSGRNQEAEIRPVSKFQFGENAEEEEEAKNDFNLEYFDCVKINTLEFINSLSPKGVLIRSKIKVDKGLFSEFTLYLEDYNNVDYPLLSTRRKKASTSVYYRINYFNVEKTSRGDKRETAITYGDLYSNLSRGKFKLVGGNENDELDVDENDSETKSNKRKNSTDTEHIPKLYFDLEYNNKLIGRAKPKELLLSLNLHNDNGDSIAFKRENQQANLLTKKPEYDAETKTFRLDFKNRAKLPSTNNIQIIDKSNPSEILLQLGKMKSKYYSLDFSYPFTAFTAFGLAVACLSRN